MFDDSFKNVFYQSMAVSNIESVPTFFKVIYERILEDIKNLNGYKIKKEDVI